MFLMVPAHPGSPGQKAVKQLLCVLYSSIISPFSMLFSALTLLVGHQEEHPVCKEIEW